MTLAVFLDLNGKKLNYFFDVNLFCKQFFILAIYLILLLLSRVCRLSNKLYLNLY